MKSNRGRKPKNGIVFVENADMKPFLTDIKGYMKELHVAIQLYEVELIQQGYSTDEASLKAAKECMKIKQDIIREDAEGLL